MIIDYLETIPEPGTSLKLRGYPLEIIQADETAVKTVRYRTLPRSAEARQ
jgi:Mg2+/Co2+ transporter CorB